MAKLKINVVVNLKPLLNVQRYAAKNKPVLLNTAANRYLQYLRNRYLSLSAGSGEWLPLQYETVKRKERRGIADNPTHILREYDAILSSLNILIKDKQTYVGFVRDKRHPRGLRVFQLVRIHAEGLRGLPKRNAIGIPPQRTLKQMVDDIRVIYNKIIRRERNSR